MIFVCLYKKVRQSRKQNYGLLNSPKKLYFGRIEETIICFRDLLTFCSHGFMDPPNIYYHAESTFYNPCWNWRAHFIYIGCNFQAVKEYSFQFPLSVTPDFFFLLRYPPPISCISDVWCNRVKVHIFWEGLKILQNLHQLFDW